MCRHPGRCPRLPALGQPRSLSGPAPPPCLTCPTCVSRPPSRKESGRQRRGGRRKEGGRKGERHRAASLRPGKAAPPPPPAERGSPRRKQLGQPGAAALVWAPSAPGAGAALREAELRCPTPTRSVGSCLESRPRSTRKRQIT